MGFEEIRTMMQMQFLVGCYLSRCSLGKDMHPPMAV